MIKFRAWDKNNKEMISWRHLLNGHNLRNVFMRTEMCGLELMQSTEFKDENGVNVYEGDVINVHWFYANFDPVELGAFENEECAERVVVKKEFGNLGFWWKEADTWVDLATLAMSARLDEESFEILGNIYEQQENR